MRPKLEKLAVENQQQSFKGYWVRVPKFEFYWHFHPEYELTMIIKGKGNRIVGDNIMPFGEGDFVLLGPNLPHVWVSDENETGPCEAMVFQFHESFFQNLLRFPELGCLYPLHTQSPRGLNFSMVAPKEKAFLKGLMKKVIEIPTVPGFMKLITELSTCKATPITLSAFKIPKTPGNTTRINNALTFIQLNFLKPISLKDAAKAIHLSESAFSKFFRRSIGKTFTNYLHDLRIAHACTLLIETDKPVSYIAHVSGFENLSYFNRVFLIRKNITPSGFRKLSKSINKAY